MNSTFLAFAFRDRDRALAAQVEKLLRSHDVVTKNGELLGGEAITPAVQELIDDCEGLIALLTRRDPLAGGGWTTHQWVMDELNYARDRGKPTVALLEQGVPCGGMYAGYQYLPYREDTPLPALLDLSQIIADWKRKSGRTLKVNLLPAPIATLIGAGGCAVRCSYKLFARNKATDWKPVQPIPQSNGEVHLYLTGIGTHHNNIQIQIMSPGKAWESWLDPECIQVTLKPTS